MKPTKIGMWLEVELVTMPIFLLYIVLTGYIYKKEAEKNVKAGKEISDIQTAEMESEVEMSEKGKGTTINDSLMEGHQT